jgi:hypothetical protein
LLVEDLLLAVIGAVLALVIGRAASSLLLQWASGSGPTIALDLRVGWEAFAFGVLFCLLL